MRKLLLFLLFPAFVHAQALIPPAGNMIVPVNSGSTVKTTPLSDISTQAPDYVVSKSGSTYTAVPSLTSGLTKYSGTDFSVVMQSAITALTPSGSAGSGGGHIHVVKGNYSENDELTITGWENTTNPYSQLIISGEGNSTAIVQNTTGKNGFVIKNNAGVVLANLVLSIGANAKSAILGDDNGSTYEQSFNRGIIDNILVQSSSTVYPAILLKNFFNLEVGTLRVFSATDGIVLDNTSATVSYGNSGWSKVYSNAGTGYAGLKCITHNSSGTQGMGMMSISHYESHTGKYGIYTSGLSFSTFDFVDIENTTNGIYLGGGTNNGGAIGNRIVNGYILNVGGDTALYTNGFSSGNDIHIYIEGGSTTKIVDQQAFNSPNSLDLTLGVNVLAANIFITTPAQTPLRYKMINGSTTTVKGPYVAHTHAESEITNLVSDLSGKASTSSVALKVNISDTAGMLTPYARGNLVTASLAGKANTSHTHAESDVTNLTADLASKLNITDTVAKWVSRGKYSADSTTRTNSYLGQVATRCFLPNNNIGAGAGRWQMTRSFHIARDKIVNPTCVFPNYRISSVTETTYGTGTIKASIEYPVGTFTLANECITASNGPVTFPIGNTALTFNVTIPKGAQFWVRVLQQNANGVVFHQYQSGYCSVSTEGWESGTSTVSDKTTSGTFTSNSITYSPIVIAAQTTQPSILIFGDSRQEGGTEGISDSTYDVGEIPRGVGREYAYTSVATSGTLLSGYLSSSHTYRDALAVYFSHIVDSYGINDIGTGGTVATLVTNRTALAALFPNQVIIGTTLNPYTSTTDGFQTQANQVLTGANNVKVTAFNVAVRAGITGEKYMWDIATAVDPFRLGRWPISRNPNDATRPTGCQFTGAISGTVLTVSAVASGTLNIGDPITDNLTTNGNVAPSTFIISLGTGTGGTGTYNVSRTHSGAPYFNAVTSTTMYVGAFATNDGLHQTAAMSEMIRDSGVIKFGFLKR